MCANLRKKFWPLLNQPASHGPFWPKLWMPLATIFVEIFEKEKNWWGSGPIGVTSWKDFEISPKKWRFEFFHRAKASTFKMSMNNLSRASHLTCWSLNLKLDVLPHQQHLLFAQPTGSLLAIHQSKLILDLYEHYGCDK